MIELALVLLWVQDAPPVEGQPLAANVERLIQALEFLGAPLPAESLGRCRAAGRDPGKLREAIEPHVLLHLSLGPSPKLALGAAPAILQQGGYTPLLIKVTNPAGSTETLRLSSPQAGPVYAGVAALSMQRQGQNSLRENENSKQDANRFLEMEIFGASPMTPRLSGLGVEYAVGLIYSSRAGACQARIELVSRQH